jgi:hypothetical protein
VDHVDWLLVDLSSLQLKEGEPLLAFSLKSRFGFSPEGVKQITLDVLRAGFHIVELDTRNLRLTNDDLGQAVDSRGRSSAPV